MSFRCIACNAAIEPRYTNCPECGEPVTDFLREYLDKPVGGNYQLVTKIGRGGMGEVYKARHVYFHNDVVIKVMRPQLAGDNSLAERFIHEARVARKITHQNVAQIFDFSALPDGSYYMVWEFIDGKTLGQIIRERGALPPDYVAQISVQALRGLEAIHLAGFVHRDISPDNIMITKDKEGKDLVKVIDLGIAKQETASGETMTGTGLFLGKLKYASPEHLGLLGAGERIDSRADLYSFGIVMYEMVAGKAPFVASTPHEYMSMHMKEPPPPLPVISNVTGVLHPLILKALEKDRRDRFKSAIEFAKQVEEIMMTAPRSVDETAVVQPEEATWVTAQSAMTATESVASEPRQRHESRHDIAVEPRQLREEDEFWEGTLEYGGESATEGRQLREETEFWEGKEYGSGSATEPIANPAVAWPRFASRSAVVAVIVAVLGFIGAFAIYEVFVKRGPQSKPPAAAEPREMAKITSSGNVGEAVISPDAKYIAYTVNEAVWGRSSIWLKQLSSGQQLKITGQERVGYGNVSFSPDSDFIYFSSHREGSNLANLNTIPIVGGISRQIATDVRSPVAVSPDGKSIAFVRQAPTQSVLMIANSDGTEERLVAKRPIVAEFWGRLDWSRDGQSIVLGTRDGHIVIIAVNGGVARQVPGEAWVYISAALWSADDMLLVNGSKKKGKYEQLWRVSPATGESVQLTDNLSGFTSMSVSSDERKICVVQRDFSAHLERLQLAGSESLQQITAGTSIDGLGGVAVFGDQIVFHSYDAGVFGLFSAKIDGSERRALTQLRDDSEPAFSADGKTIAYMFDASSSTTIHLIDSDGSNDRALAGVQRDVFGPQFSPDGKTIIYAWYQGARTFLWRVPVTGGKPVPITAKPAFAPAVSPNGQWIACLDDAGGVSIMAFDGGDLKQLYKAKVETVRWTPDSKAIIAAEISGDTTNLFMHPIDGGPVRQLTRFTSGIIWSFDLTRDGRTAILSRGTIVSDAVLLTLK